MCYKYHLAEKEAEDLIARRTRDIFDISKQNLKDWSSMTRSQYTLTEDDLGDFNIIFEKLGVSLILINHIEDNKLKNKKGKKMSSNIKITTILIIPSNILIWYGNN
ncbi:MAG TPA: hypothetical protein ENH75_01100 [archaeon]|nr:hypothetical protein [archaeon]